MPGLNKTGPMGQGARTGRGLGLCGGKIKKGYGCRGAYGRGYNFRSFIASENPISLNDQEKMLEEELTEIRRKKAALKDQQK
jgi:hypothetical protein